MAENFVFERFFVGVPKPSELTKTDTESYDGDVTLSGMPVSQGQVKAHVRVIKDINMAHTIQVSCSNTTVPIQLCLLILNTRMMLPMVAGGKVGG